jgi:aconitate hydratase
MGVLPLQFKGGDSAFALGLDGTEVIDIVIPEALHPQMDVKLVATKEDGSVIETMLLLRIDTPIEVDYYNNGGILPFVLRQLLAA